MAPKIEQNNQYKLFKPVKPFDFLPKPQVKPEPVKFVPIEKRADFIIQGTEQRERLERLLGAGTAGMSNAMLRYRGEAFQKASLAYHRVMKEGLANSATPDLAKLTRQAVSEYEGVLKQYKISPSEAPSYSIVNQLNMLDTEASRPGDLFTLSSQQVKSLVAAGETPKVFVRMLKIGSYDADGKFTSFIDNANARLGYYDSSKKLGKTITWSTTPEDLMGSKLDYQEVMKRIGWTSADIATANPKEFKLVVFTEESAVNLKVPTEQNIIDLARKDESNFEVFQNKDDGFWNKVVKFDYEASLKDAAAQKYKPADYLLYARRNLPQDQFEIAKARYQMENSMGVNPLFSGDGITKRPDNINNRVGGREFVTQNNADNTTLFEMSKRGQVAFIDLQNHGVTEKTPVNISETPVNAPVLSNRQLLASETRMGGIMGGTFSAATSLYQVFGEGKQMNAKTFAGYTALGTGVGSLSAAGEQLIGNRIASSLSRSNLADRGLSNLYNSGAARNIVSRFAGTEASNITSSTFNSTVRTLAGRVGGAGIVGGVVNGAFSAYDQIGAYNRGEVTASQAIGTVTGETAVGVGAGLAGAAAGAAIGSIIPGAGTVVGGIIGFGVGMAAGYFADKGLRELGVNTMIAQGVTSLIDGAPEVARTVGNAFSDAGKAVGNFAEDVGGAISGGLKSIFG